VSPAILACMCLQVSISEIASFYKFTLQPLLVQTQCYLMMCPRVDCDVLSAVDVGGRCKATHFRYTAAIIAVGLLLQQDSGLAAAACCACSACIQSSWIVTGHLGALGGLAALKFGPLPGASS
jgi:hypothetical protein